MICLIYPPLQNYHFSCVRSPDLVRLLGSRREYLWIDATFHGQGGSATEKILDRIDNEMSFLEETGDAKPNFLVDETIPSVVRSIYGENTASVRRTAHFENKIQFFRFRHSTRAATQ